MLCLTDPVKDVCGHYAPQMTARDRENEASGLLAASLRFGHIMGRGVFPGSGIGGDPPPRHCGMGEASHFRGC